MHHPLGPAAAGLLWVLATCVVPQTLGAQPGTSEAVSKVMAFRQGPMADATLFDACSVFDAAGRPGSFPEGIAPGLRTLLDRTDAGECAGMRSPRPGESRVVMDSVVVVSDSVVQVHVSVRRRHSFHREAFDVSWNARRGEWGVRQVRLAGAVPVACLDCGRGTVGAEALIVVDGVVLGPAGERGEAWSECIRSEDVESIQVLKGTAAVGVYGAEAANGAIVIRLREGRSLLAGCSPNGAAQARPTTAAPASAAVSFRVGVLPDSNAVRPL